MPEQQLIEGIRRRAKRLRGGGQRSPVIAGIGDDCAVLRLAVGSETLVTTDFTLEGTHFRRDWHPAEAVGHRALARGLSDIAAMGGEPVAAFLSLALPADLPSRWEQRFLDGLMALAKRCGVRLAGGDVAESSSGVLADIVVLGEVPAECAILRSGASAGDSIYVTGELGHSAAALEALRRGGLQAFRKLPKATRQAHLFPQPQLEAGRKLRGLASAMIDVSDGLSTDLGHICEQSRVGALVAEHSIPRPAGLATSSLHYALHGGDDYQLLFTASGQARVPARIGGVRVTRIGQIVRGKGIFLVDSHGQRKKVAGGGWQHFSKR